MLNFVLFKIEYTIQLNMTKYHGHWKFPLSLIQHNSFRYADDVLTKNFEEVFNLEI